MKVAIVGSREKKVRGREVKLILTDITGIEIFPGNLGRDCIGNGEHFDEKGNAIQCCCDECDYLLCCLDKNYPHTCADCITEYCPRKFYRRGREIGLRAN